MAQSSEKKRKRAGDSTAKPKKKVAIDAPPATATITSILRPKACPPVIGMRSKKVFLQVFGLNADGKMQRRHLDSNYRTISHSTSMPRIMMRN